MRNFKRQIHLLISFFILSLFAKAQQPVVNSLNPSSGFPGSTVIISGSGFNAVAANNIVFFGATKAQAIAASPVQLSVQVPAGSSFSAVTVTTPTGTAYSQKIFMPTHPGGVGNFNNRFLATPFNITTGTSPVAVVLCDFDGDGKVDLASANSAEASFSVCRNIGTNGTFSFAGKVDFTAAAGPFGMTTGDLNADGKPDVALTTLDGISIYINNSTTGNISFAPKADFAVGTTPRGIDINDVDGDGKADIACANSQSSNFSVLRNTSTGVVLSFAPAVNFATFGSPYYISLRDFDGDGKADASNGYVYGGSISVFRNTSTPGAINFAARLDYATGGVGIACGDIDGDGKDDIASAGFSGSNISILRNTSSIGAISFAATVNFQLNNQAQPSHICIGDMNGDGKPDLVVPDKFSSTRNPEVDVFRNTSTVGNISMAARAFYPLAVSSDPAFTVIGDINGDGRPDIGVSCAGLARVALFKNLASPIVSSFSPVSAPAGASITISGYNFKADPAENIVSFGGVKATVTSASNTSLTVSVPAGSTYLPVTVTADGLTGQARLPFTLTFSGGDSIIANSFADRKIFAAAGSGQDATIADFDGDGKNDVSIHTYSISSNSIYRNTSASGDVTFSAPVTVSNFSSATRALVAGDLNGDGKPELVSAGGSNNVINIYRNTSVTGTISFATSMNIGVSAEAMNVYIADMNADGLPDIIVDTRGNIVVIPNTSTASTLSFGTNRYFPMVIYLDKVVVADFDGDGKTDIVSGQSYMKNTSVNGVISFGPLTSFAPQAYHDYYVTGDFNSDGKPDIAELKTDSARIRIYVNTSTSGNISFALQPTKYSTGAYPVKMSVADLNGDGRLDISVANQEYDAVSVLANTGSAGNTSFANKVDYAAGRWPWATATGDLDGDAKPDMVIPNFQTATFSVLRFAADIPPANIPNISSFLPLSGAVGDTILISGNNFSNNPADNIVMFGSAKAIVVNASTNALQVKVPVGASNKSFTVTNSAGLTGYSKKPFNITFSGAGRIFTSNSFDTATLFAAADGARGVYVGDVDGDGKNDVVTANENNNNISVFRNTSDTGFIDFAARLDIAAGSQPKACAMADLNADGKPELLVANSGNNILMVYRNTSTAGTVSYAAPASFPTDSSSFGTPVAIAIHDMDGDGKPDVAVTNTNSTYITIFRNSFSTPGGAISLVNRVSYKGGNSPKSISIEDIDGNGKPDLVIGNSSNEVSVLSNTSVTGAISFTRGISFIPYSFPHGVVGLTTTDLNEDGKADIAIATTSNGFSRLLNRSVRGTQIFEPVIDFGPTIYSAGIATDDLDGDGRTDIAIIDLFNRTVAVVKNNYNLVDTSYFKPAVFYSVTPSPNTPLAITTGDIDGDGKPDIITTSMSNNFLSILRNKTGEPVRLCPNGGVTLESGIDYATYQWQLSTDGGLVFSDISDNSYYSGTNTASLQLSNIPSSFTGYKYRCATSAGNSVVFTIRFFNIWTGAIDNAWENPANWSCGTVPDLFTDVVIGAGSNVVLNSNVTIATISVNSNAIFTVGTGFTLTLIGH